jgi:MFS family permease
VVARITSSLDIKKPSVVTSRHNETMMKPRIGVYLSQDLAARLAVAVAAQRPGITRSALVEAALDRFLGSDDEGNELSVNHRLGMMSRQLELLGRDLRVVSETVALQARFHLAVTPPLPATTVLEACALGAERFDEFAAQVGRRVHQGTSLMRETIDRLAAARQKFPTSHFGEGTPQTGSPRREPDLSAEGASERVPAAGEDGSHSNFPGQRGIPCAESVAEREGGHGAEAAASPRIPSSGYATLCRSNGDPSKDQVPTWYLMLRVFLPFVAAYYLSFLFRSINATIAGSLTSEFGLNAGDLGLLTSVYFLTFAAAQIPIGILLDRYGPRLVQSIMLMAAVAGAALFAAADNLVLLLIGRALIGLGVAAALTSGLKALVLWFPRDRVPLLNGLMIMLGALGAVSATLPAEFLLASMGWRGLFELLAAASAACALMIYLVVPKTAPAMSAAAGGATTAGLKTIYADPRFWRLAPLSAICIGTAWALQGLWAASWFSDVEGLEREAMLRNLFVMAVALGVGALVLGVTVDRLRRRGVGPRSLLGCVSTLFIAAQVALILRLPLPSFIPWAIVATVGAATVLSYAILAEYFPKELTGRANAALNVFHIGGAFVVQSMTGVVVQLWTPIEGHYPAVAYQTAFALNVGLQVVAAVWFAWPEVQAYLRRRRQPHATCSMCSRRSNSSEQVAFG